MTFPEKFGPFEIWAADADRGVTEWQISDGGGWYPIALADRDACVFFAGAMTAGMTMDQVQVLRDQHNHATPPAGVTVKHLLDHLEPGWNDATCEDCGEPRPADGIHRCEDHEETP